VGPDHHDVIIHEIVKEPGERVSNEELNPTVLWLKLSSFPAIDSVLISTCGFKELALNVTLPVIESNIT
jgi:hypothetical protein